MIKFATDLDGTMTDIQKYILLSGTRYLRERGISYALDRTQYDFPGMFGIEPVLCEEMLHEISEDMYINIKLEPGVEDALREFPRIGLLPGIVTARDPNEKLVSGKTLGEVTETWMWNKGLANLPLHFVKNKGKFCADNGYVYLLDDYSVNLLDAATHSVVPIAFTRSHNETLAVQHVDSWPLLLQKLKRRVPRIAV